MDGVGSWMSQAQPLRERLERRLQTGTTGTPPDGADPEDSSWPPPQAPSAPRPSTTPWAALPSPPVPIAPVPVALTPPDPAGVASTSPVLASLPAPASPPALISTPAAAVAAPFVPTPVAPAAQVPVTPAAPTSIAAAAPAAPAIDPARLAQLRANRKHRRRYTLPRPFSIRGRKIDKTIEPMASGNTRGALPARLSDLVRERRNTARVTHRLAARRNLGWRWFRSAFLGPIQAQDRRQYARLVGQSLDPMPAMVLTALLAHSMKWLSPGRRARLIDGLGLLRKKEARQLATYMFDNPGIAHQLRCSYMVQERLELYQGGDSFSTYLRFVRQFTPPLSALPKTAAARAEVLATPVQLAPAPLRLGGLWEAHGRTLHFTDASSGQTMGLKLRKDATDATALEREDVMDQCFAKWKPALGLSGTFPRSRGLLLFSPDARQRAAIAAQAAAHGAPQFDIGDAAVMPALLYEAPADYHVHLHEVPSFKGLRQASTKALADAGRLAGRLGLVHMSPADFYHNREKDRRWYWNVDQVKKAMFGRIGTGRLDRVDAGVRYYNAGPSGLRDLKHLAFYDDVKGDYGDDAALALTSTMGDFLLAWTLSACKWFRDHDQLDKGLDIQHVLREGFTTYFTAFTGRDADDCETFLSEMVNWPLLTRQVQYFCSEAYVEDIKQKRVPRHVLDEGTIARADVPQEGWNTQHGWMLDGENRDLGPKNGPFPLTELVAALYLTTHFGAALRVQDNA